MWVRYYWNDSSIHWNPADYSDVTEITMPTQDTWTPGLFLDHFRSKEFYKRVPYIFVRITHTGYSYLYTPLYSYTACSLQVAAFPFDEQTCDLNFTSYFLTTENLKFVLNKGMGADLSNYRKNTEWGLVSFTAFATEETGRQGCSDCVYSVIVFRLVFRRRWQQRFYYYYAPNIILNLFTTIQFALPIDSGERMEWSSACYLAVALFKQLIYFTFSSSKEFPIWVTYIAFTSVITACSQVLTILSIYIHKQGTHDNFRTVPIWLRNLVLHKVAWFVGLEPAALEEENVPVNVDEVVVADDDETIGLEHLNKERKITFSHLGHEESYNEVESIGSEENYTSVDRSRTKTFANIKGYLSRFKTSIFAPKEPKTMESRRRGITYGRRRTLEAMSSKNMSMILEEIEHLRQASLLGTRFKQNKEETIYNILKYMQLLDEKYEEKKRIHALRSEWKQVTMVLNRVLMVIFFVANVITWVIVLVQIPRYEREVYL